MSVNKVIVMGNLGSDPEVRHLPDGRAVVNFSVACSEKWKDKATGEIKENTEWVRAVCFGKRGEVIGEHFKKGQQIYIEGKMRTRKWQGTDGTDRYTTEVVVDEFQFCGNKPSGNTGDARAQQQASAYSQNKTAAPQSDNPPTSAYNNAYPSDFDDDIPF
jgi:single-strand DNA-binding protein